MEDVTQVSDRGQSSQTHAMATRTSRRIGWFPRVARPELVAPHAKHAHRYTALTARAISLPLPAAAPPSSPKPPAPRHDLIALRKACEAQAFSAYAHALSREEYERAEYQRAAPWQRQAADATRGAIMYRELARVLFSAGRD